MERRRRSGVFPDASYWRWWLGREAKAILLGIGLLALLVAIAFYALRQAGRPTETFEATVLRFGMSSSEEGNRPLVLVRTADGRIRQLHAHRSRLIGCRPGAAIRLMKRGALLNVDPSGCRPNRRAD
jgi:hypothetical protein